MKKSSKAANLQSDMQELNYELLARCSDDGRKCFMRFSCRMF